MKRPEDKINKMNRSIMLLAALVLIVLVFFALRYARTSAVGASLFTNSLIISDYSTAPSALPVSGAIWDSASFPAGKVNFNVNVRGRRGVINYYFWSSCSPAYNGGNVYSVADLNAICTRNYDYNHSINTSSLWRNHTFSFTYATAGVYRAVIMVERNGVFIHKSMPIELKPYIDLSIEYSDNSAFPIPISHDADGVYTPTVQTVNDIDYDQFARLRWSVKGVSATTTCTPTGSGGWSSSGQKGINGTYDLGRMSGGTYTYRLTCSYNSSTNYDEITVNIPPKVELQGLIPGFDPVIAGNNETIDLGSITAGMALNSIVYLTGWSTGANKCDLKSDPAAAVWPFTINVPSIVGRRQLFINQASNGINGTTNFILECTRDANPPVIPLPLTSRATVRVVSSSGNCAFKGNNNIQAMTFCKNSLLTLNSADNIQMKGAFVAKNFSIDNGTDNIRFFYDYNTGDKVPPGFRYLNIPSPKEVGNSGN